MPDTLVAPGPETETDPRQPFRISEWPVVRKVALVLAVPLLLAGVLGGLRVNDELAVASSANSTASQITVLGPAVTYLSAAEDAALVFRSSNDDDRREAALKQVNDAAARLESAWSNADLSSLQRTQVRQLLDQTQGLRDGSAYKIASTAAQTLQALEAQVTLGIAGMTDASAATQSLIGVVGHLNTGRLAVVRQQMLVVVDPDVIPQEELYGFLGVESAAIANLELLLPDDEQVELLRQYNASNAGQLGIGAADLKGQAPLKLYDELTVDVLERIESSLAGQASAANRTAVVTAVLTGLALFLAVILALFVSRQLVLPIRRVRDAALAVAHDELPDTVRRIRAGEDPGAISTIPVTTQEEMGQLARAVDDLHGTAVRLALDEAELRSRVADMFVTLSRRNTSLVNQQLRLIERLETDEEDPQRLESLFKLDHLASRMRRTAESLVVLADAPTQASEQDALSVDEALQAALAGVQEYQRVRVSGAPSLRVAGAAAADLVHLFTELVDNALAFSSPTTDVEITSATPAGLVLVEIADRGLGIDPVTLTELNQTLRNGAQITADTTRRMGLFVVARLARRHGITVSLERNADGGTTARVFIPRTVLATGSGAPASDQEPETALATVTPVVPDAPEASEGSEADELPDVVPVPQVATLDVAEELDEADGPETADELGVADEPDEAELDEEQEEDAVPDQPVTTVPPRPVPAPVRPNLADAMFRRPAPADAPEPPQQPAPASASAPEPVRSPAPPAPAPAAPAAAAPAPATGGIDPLSAVISANIGLPQRRPGSSEQPEPLTPLLLRKAAAEKARQSRQAAPAAAPVVPVVPPPTVAATTEPVESVDVAEVPEVVETPEVAEVPGDVVVEDPTDHQALEEVTATDPAEAVEADADAELDLRPDEDDERVAGSLASVSALRTPPLGHQPTDEAPADEEPADEEPADVLDVLGSPSAYSPDEDVEEETPLFRQLRSSWFTHDDEGKDWGDGRADAGWEAVEKVAGAAPSRLTQSGLPVRDPGNRLVPGGMAQEVPVLHRDPEAIRARLSAHAAGVARGRSAASAAAARPTEPAEDVTPR